MRIAALYDIHGNLPALEAVLKDIEGEDVDEIVVGGDIVLGPMTRECLDIFLNFEKPVRFIRGNCESAVLDQIDGRPLPNLPESVLEDIRWTANQHASGHREALVKFSKTVAIGFEKHGKILFCHATPRNDNENFTVITPEKDLVPVFERLNSKTVVCGHTHMQFDRKIGDTRVLNAGSVGMPFGKRGADWLLVGSEIEFRHTDYDTDAASERIINTSYPNAREFVDKYVLDSPSEELMREILSGIKP